MQELVGLIGPAPSEIPIEDLVSRLRIEHTRVANGLASATRYTKPVKAKKTKRVNKAAVMDAMASELGLSIEDMQRLLEKGKNL